MDESWLYHYDPETKQQSMEWRHTGSPRPKKISSAKIRWKISRLDFFGIKTASFSLIIFHRAKLSTHLCWCKKNAGCGKVTVVQEHDNAPAHRTLATQKKLAYLGFQCLDHPTYSPDLAPSDLFPGLKKQLKGHHFSSDAEVIASAETWLDGQPSEFFLSGL